MFHWSCIFIICSFGTAGSIHVSNILTGKCVAKINTTISCARADECSRSGCSCRESLYPCLMRNSVTEALEDITALFYDEDRNEIYTGNRHGLLHVWSNWWVFMFLLASWAKKLHLWVFPFDDGTISALDFRNTSYLSIVTLVYVKL